MKSDINSLKLTKEEKTIISDYFKYVRYKMNHPTHPEIVIGCSRYPLGRLVLRRTVAKNFIQKYDILFAKGERYYHTKIKVVLGYLEKVLELYTKTLDRGKTVKKEKRK